MDWLEQNLDAYRILAEILNDLRIELRQELEKIHGTDWFRPGLPPAVFDRLISTKEGSSAIDWYETEYQEIMDFAVFPDFFEILEHNRETFAALMELVPSPALFQARFLELESLRSKVGRARPVSEAELSFLMTFHKRFRRQLEVHRSGVSKGKPVKNSSEEISIETGEPEVGTEEAPEPSKTMPDNPPTPPANITPPQRPAMTGTETDPEEAKELDESKSPSNGAAESTILTGPLSQVVSAGDSTAILRELFKEVTSLAESLWSSDVPPPQTVWKEVRVSSWYEENFSGLGLKPLSDFYEVISHVEERLGTGLAKHELQKMLEDANFAHILLALRDMFQKNRI
ncbi:MAG: hypothetical protein ABFS37_07585 [Acidobacteriota bacterium]